MDEIIKASGCRPSQHDGYLVKSVPSKAWEYRIIDYGDGDGDGPFFAQICCIECLHLTTCRMDASCKNTIGAVVCPHCNRKAYVRIDGIWFECG